MYAIDTHCHFWPAAFLESMRGGREYLGWSAHNVTGDVFVLEGRRSQARATLPPTDLADAVTRIETRNEQQGIVMEAVMLTGFLWNYHLGEQDSVAFARAVNDELADLERSSKSHVGLGHLPLPHTRAAIAEVERAVKELGLRHFGLGTNFEGRNFDHPDVAPVLDAIAEAGATVSVHPVFFDGLGTPERLTSPLLKGGLQSPLEIGLAMTTVVTSGVLDRHPEFRVWVSHGGGAAMFAIGRLDRRWGSMAAADRPMAQTMSDYLRRFWYGNLLHNDTQLQFLMSMVGDDRVTVGTDYPYPWDHPMGSANWIRAAEFLDGGQRRNVLWKNAAEFLGVEPTWIGEEG